METRTMPDVGYDGARHLCHVSSRPYFDQRRASRRMCSCIKDLTKRTQRGSYTIKRSVYVFVAAMHGAEYTPKNPSVCGPRSTPFLVVARSSRNALREHRLSPLKIS